MRREVLIGALTRIRQELEAARIPEVLHKDEEKRRSDPTEVLSALRNYTARTSGYSNVERTIIATLNLEPLFDAEGWIALLSPDPRGMTLAKDVENAITVIPKIVQLIEPEGRAIIRGSNKSEIPEILREKEELQIIVTEDEGNFSNPRRVVYAIESVSTLYSVLARTN